MTLSSRLAGLRNAPIPSRHRKLPRSIARRRFFECLEPRLMLTGASVENGLLVVSDPAATDDRLTLTTSGSSLVITDATNALTAGTGTTQAAPRSITVALSSIPLGVEVRGGGGDDELLLQSIDFAGGKVEVRSVARVSFAANSLVEAVAGIDIEGTESIAVGAGAVLSTRDVAGTPTTTNSRGDSGALSLAAPSITVAANSELLAHVNPGSSHQPGPVSLVAENVVTSAEFLLQGVAQVDPRAVERTATISVGQGAVIRGADVRLQAESGDFIPDSLSASELTLIENLSVPALGYATKEIAVPALTAMKNSAAQVLVGDGAQIASSGDVVIDARANATAKMTVVSGAGVLGGTPLSIFSIVYTRADASAQSIVGDHASIVATGTVNVLSHSEAEASSTSRTTKNVGNARPRNKDDLALSAAISDVNNTSYATVGDRLGRGPHLCPRDRCQQELGQRRKRNL